MPIIRIQCDKKSLTLDRILDKDRTNKIITIIDLGDLKLNHFLRYIFHEIQFNGEYNKEVTANSQGVCDCKEVRLLMEYPTPSRKKSYLSPKP